MTNWLQKAKDNKVTRRLIPLANSLKEAVNEFLTDNCPHLAASISYYFLLSLFPMVLASVSIFGLVLKSGEATGEGATGITIQDRVTDAVLEFLPVGERLVSSALDEVSDNWRTAGILAIIGLLWAGMAVFNAVRKSLNAAWGIRQPRPFLHERALEFGMMSGLGLLLFLSIGMTSAAKIIRDADLPVLGDRLTDGSLLWNSLPIIISFFLTLLAFLFLYKIVPNTKVPWRHAFFGALVATILFELVKQVFVLYTGRFITSNVLYAGLGPLVLLMGWVYVSSVIMLFCGKLISKYPSIKASLSIRTAPEILIENTLELDHSESTESTIANQWNIPSPSAVLSGISVAIFGNPGTSRHIKTEED